VAGGESDRPFDLGELVVVLEKALAERDAVIGELRDLVAAQAAKIEELAEKLERNSGNSHHPPSSDGPGAAARGKRRPTKGKSKRKRGGQKGRRGAHRSLVEPGKVDETVDLFPCACEGCAAALPRVPDSDARRYQQFEWLLGRGWVKEWRRHEVECLRCGHRTLAAFDPQQIPASPFGPRLVAHVAMLTGAYHLSRRATQRLLREMFGIDVSLGAISKMEGRASAALESAYEEAVGEAQQAPVKHADGTTWLLAGITMSLWTFASAMTTVYRIFDDGCRDTIRPLFGKLVGILVSDRASVFGFWDMALRQVCWAHLLRKFVAFSERDGPAGELGREMLTYAALVFDYWHGLQDGTLTRDEFVAWMRPVQRQFEAVLQRAVAAELPRMSGSCRDILAHRDALWTFVTHEGVEPTNNHAERELRPGVLWRKRSFGSQSERGLRFVERVMTVVHTARKRGIDVLDFVVRSVAAYHDGAAAPALAAG
jgi:transposase